MGHRLVVDGQIFQTPAWHRGMGKYSLALLARLSQSRRNTPWRSIDIILSSRLPLDPKMVVELSQKTAGANIVKLNLLPNESSTIPPVKHNRQVINEYLGASGTRETTDYLILSLMQQEIYPVFPTARPVKKLLLFYDLIPLTRPDIYLNSPVTEADYLIKFRELLKADKYLAISKTAANDLAALLGIDKGRITSIDGGPIDHGAGGQRIEAPKPFILMPTGNDLRKNNERGVRAFSLFNDKNANRYNLVITSFFEESEISRFKTLSGNLVFTGNITDGQLGYLYEEAEGLLFPSEYEGLGLPILEAVEKNKPVACSDIPVFREISEKAFHYFDPRSVTGIAEALSAMAVQLAPDPKAYDKVRKTYAWEATVGRLIDAVADTATGDKPRKKTAMFGPSPSNDDPAAGNILLGHAEFSRQRDVDYYLGRPVGQLAARVNFLPYVTGAKAIVPGFGFDPSGYDEVFYSIGNGSGFSGALFTALAVPGVVILYDLRLDATWSSMAKEGLINGSRLSLEKQLQEDYGDSDTALLVSLLARQKAVLVFGEASQKALVATLNKIGSKTKIHVLKPPVTTMVYGEILPVEKPRASSNKSSGTGQYSYKEYAEAILEAAGNNNG